jgi:hypothetical protein
LQVLMEDEKDDTTREAYHALMNLRNQIFDDPSQDLNEWAKKLRQANFKQQYKLRQGVHLHPDIEHGVLMLNEAEQQELDDEDEQYGQLNNQMQRF